MYKIFIDNNIIERFWVDNVTTADYWKYGYNPGIDVDLRIGEAGIRNLEIVF